jgi:arylsulfatase A-like enzyme
MVGRLVGVLRQTGELSNTYTVFTSDNGLHLGEHRINKKKWTAYEEAIHVPLLVRGPGVPRGVSRSQMALNNDLAPTFASLAGLTPPGFVDGHSLSPLLSTSPPSSWRSALLVEHWQDENGDPYAATIADYKALRTGRYLFVRYATGEMELYDLSKLATLETGLTHRLLVAGVLRPHRCLPRAVQWRRTLRDVRSTPE